MIEKIVWDDATGGMGRFNVVKNTPASQLLIRSVSYGEVISEDERAIVLIHDYNANEDTEYTAIPKGWIISRTELVSKHERGYSNEC